MNLEVGKIYEGKVTGITKFGAFVELDKNTTGMVHISEIANTFVNEIRDHISEGQEVKVKVLSLGDDGKISLSIKKAMPAPARGDRSERAPRNDRRQDKRRQGGFKNQKKSFEPSEPVDLTKTPPPVYVARTSDDSNFEDMMSRFKATSEEKFSDLKHVLDNKRRGSSRRK
ncbi:MAG: S1 RNA-binding domain-containing protein [Ruminococcus sp.]|nr:S1 RNA-binding domain-containing protein [Ruminococcus sp.]